MVAPLDELALSCLPETLPASFSGFPCLLAPVGDEFLTLLQAPFLSPLAPTPAQQKTPLSSQEGLPSGCPHGLVWP